MSEELAAAVGAVDRLLGHRVLRRHSAQVSGESAVRGGWASAALEGAVTPLAELPAVAVAEPVLAGALRATGAVGGLADTWGRAPWQVLARLHTLAAAGSVALDRLGRPVADPAIAGRLEALARLVVGATGQPAILLAAVVHGELQSLQPFGSRDGIVARAAARITMVSRGLDPKSVSVPEIGHLELQDEYAPALAAYQSATPDGVAAWLRHCCQAVALGAREGLAICDAVQRG